MQLVKNQKPRRQRAVRRGVTVVEFALTLPLLLMLVIGLIEFARLSTLRHAADNAAYEAARHVIVPGANVAEAVSEANDLLARAGVRKASIEVNPAVITEETEQVTVQVSVPLAGNSWLPPKLTANRMVVRETTLRTERAALVNGAAQTSPVPPPGPTPSPPRTGGSSSTGGGAGGRTSGGTSRPGSRRPSGGGSSSRPRSSGGGSSRPSGGGGGGGGGSRPSGGGGGSSSGGGGGGGSSSGGGGGGGGIAL
jgi:hypothetical protein